MSRSTARNSRNHCNWTKSGMSRRMLRNGLLGLLMLAAGTVHAADSLAPYTAIYQVDRDGTLLGRARFTLSPQGENCYLYHGVATPERLAALLAGKTVEESHFCMQGGKIRPVSYRSEESGGKDNYALKFDWVNRLVRTDGGAPRKLSSEGVDPLSLQLALRKVLSDTDGGSPPDPIRLLVVEDDEEKAYNFRAVGRETIETPIGKFETMRLDRSDDSKRKLRLWLAPELAYLPVQVERQKGGGAVTRLRIETLPDSPVD